MTAVLLDQGLAPNAAAILRERGVDAIHVLEIGLDRSEDVTFNTRHLAEGARDFGIQVMRPGEAWKQVQSHEKK